MSTHASPTDQKLNTEQSYLRRIDMRIRYLSANEPGSAELVRMQSAREDVLTRISPEEMVAYEKVMNPQKTREQLAAEAQAERLAMEANKDKPPI